MIIRLEKGNNWCEIDPINILCRWEDKYHGIHSGGWAPIPLNKNVNSFIKDGYSIGYKSTNMTSCCGGKGGERWEADKAQWSCRDCGMVKSNDPNYVYRTGDSVAVKPLGTYEYEFTPNYKNKECEHQWTSYTGLKDQYEFCKKCDIKR